MTPAAEPAERTSAEIGGPVHRSRPNWFGPGLVAVAGCMLLVLAVDRLVRGIAAVHQQVEAMYGESIIYDQAARLVHGQALYQPLGETPLSVTAYTPLYYTLVAGLRVVFGPGFGPGRVLSFAAGLTAAILVGRLASRRATDGRAGIFAALLFVGLAFPGDYPWFAFYKEDVLGVALSLGAIAVLDGGSDRRRAVVAGALAGFAFLTKQTFLAASLAGVAWLWYRDKGSALAFATTAFVVGAGPCIFLAFSNDAFLANTVRANLNPSSTDILVSNLQTMARYQAIPIGMALLPVICRATSIRRWAHDPLVAFWLISLLLLPISLGKVGSNWNYWIEAAGATAPLATWGIWTLAVRGRIGGFGHLAASAALVALLASPAWLLPPVADLGAVVTGSIHPDEVQATEFAGVLQRVRDEPREVFAEPLDILVLADRRIVFEPYIFSVLYREGQWDPSSLVHQICLGQIGLLVLDHPLDGPDWEYQGYAHWPVPVLEALRATMDLERRQARLFLYVPASKATAARVAACGTV